MNPARIDASSDSVKRSRYCCAARVEPAQRGGVEEFAGAEERGHDAIFAAESRCSRDRYIHPRRSDAALRQAVDIRNRLRAGGIAHLHGCAAGRRRARAHPVSRAAERRLYHVVVLGGEVDAVLQLLTHQHVGRRVGGHEVRDRCRTGVDRRHLNGVVVGVRGAGNLPDPQPFVIGLPCEVIALPRASEEVGSVMIVSNGTRKSGRNAAAWGAPACSSKMELLSSGAAGPNREWTKKPSYDLGQRVDGVDVGGEEHGRLRLTQRDDVSGREGHPKCRAPAFLMRPPIWEKMS